MRRTPIALAALAAAVLAGCGGSAEAPAPAPASPASSAPAAPVEVDRTDDVTAELDDDLAASVTGATEVEPGRIEVATTLVDPRGDNGSDEAGQAVEVCEAAAGLDDVTYVNVLEDDGTSWILYGHPTYGDSCTEV